MSRHTAVCLLLAIVLVPGAEGLARGDPSEAVSPAQAVPAKAQSARRWALTFGGGAVHAGPSAAIEKGMSAGGLNSTQVFAGTRIYYPFTAGGHGALTARLSYRVRPGLQVGVLRSGFVDLGETSGYRGAASCCPPGVPMTFLTVHPSVRSSAALASFDIEGGLHVGAGPSWNSIRVDKDSPVGVPAVRSTRIGFVVDAGIALPARTRFFVDVSVQYRYVGNVPLGPFRGFGDGEATMPRTRAPFNHTVIGLAIGFRL